MDNDDLEVEDVMNIAETGEVIAYYAGDKPHPSKLVLGWTADEKPVHVVYATDSEMRKHIITVYRPDREIWEENFRKKKRRKS